MRKSANNSGNYFKNGIPIYYFFKLGKLIKYILLRTASEQGVDIDCDTFFDGSSLIKAVTEERICFDLIYLDIELEDVNGIHTALELRKAELPALIIYTSGHEEYLKELFSTNPFRFLSKPIDEMSFRSVFFSACEEIGKRAGYFTFFYKKACYRIPLSRITCFESRSRIITIHTAGPDNKKAGSLQNQFYGTLNETQKQIAALNERFLRIHQSFLVNFDYIKMITASDIEMMDGTRIQISEDRRKTVKARFLALAEVKNL